MKLSGILVVLSSVFRVCHAESAYELLEDIKNQQDLSGVKYMYEIPEHYEKPTGQFHQYFNHYKVKQEITSDSRNAGALKLQDNKTLYYNDEELNEYGFIDFDLPLGELRQIDEDVFDQVITPEYTSLCKLESMAEEGDLDAIKIVADIHTMGLYDIQVDLQRAQSLYVELTKSSSREMQGYGHFMLAVFYSAGLFGKVEKDVAKGLIHYKFASDLGNIQAQMAMAHKYMFGINVTKDFDMAVYYFSLVSAQSTFASKQTDFHAPLVDKFNIRWSDVKDGVYGAFASQYLDSITYFEKFKDYEEIKKFTAHNAFSEEPVEDYTLGNDETLDAFSVMYFKTQKNYRGDYLHARDLESAFENAKLCVANGLKEPEVKLFYDEVMREQNSNYTSTPKDSTLGFLTAPEITPLTIFVGRCSQYLAHMYMNGEGGAEKNDKDAFFYAYLGRKMTYGQSFVNDLVIMLYNGIGTQNNTEMAIKTVHSTFKYASSRYLKALITITETGLDASSMALLTASAPYYSLAMRKMIELYESGTVPEITSETICKHFNSYFKLAENDYFDFRLPFYAFINAKANDITSNNMWTAMVGMAIASELGYETAQSSLGYILYPTNGEFGKRSFKDSEYAQTKIYTAKRYLEAISYFEQSAIHTNRDSINILGDMYYNGLHRGVPKDDPLWGEELWKYLLPVSKLNETSDTLIFKLITKLWDTKSKIPKLTSSDFQDSTTIIPRDIDRAIAQYHEASSTGSHMGSFNIGWAYEYGIGVVQDLHLAKRYYDLALTRSTEAYVPVKIAVLRIKFKAMLWNWIGFDGRGVKELRLDKKTWSDRLQFLKRWFTDDPKNT